MKYVLFRYSKLTNFNSILIVIQNAYSQSLRVEMFTTYRVVKKNFITIFYGWSSTASRLEPLLGGSLLFTTKFPKIPGTHFIDLGRMKG